MNFVIIVLIALTFTSRIIGLGREMSLAYFYGATNISDAYLMSIAIPTIIVTIFIASLATSYIPVYQKNRTDSLAENLFTNKVMGLSLIASFFILILSLIFTPQIVPLFVSGFDSATMALTINLTRITLFAIFFMGMNQILHSFMQVKEKVLLASLSGLPFNLVAILFIVISAHTHLHFLAVGTVLAMGAQCIFLLILAKRQGFKLKPNFQLKDESVNKLLILTLPIILTNTVEQIGIMVDKNLASQFGPGAVSSLSYATRTSTALSGIFITSILIVTFPKIAKLAATENMTAMKNSLAESIVAMSLFILPAIAAVMMFAHPVISLLFGRGAFDAEAISVTSSLLFYYIFFLFGNGLTQLTSRVFISMGDSKTPMIVATITVIINIALNILLTSFVGIVGLALATSISALIGLAILLFLLRYKIGSLRLRKTVISLSKIASASVIMAFGAYFIYQYILPFNPIIALASSAVVGIGIYGILLLILRIREVDYLISAVAHQIKKRIDEKRDF